MYIIYHNRVDPVPRTRLETGEFHTAAVLCFIYK